MSSDIIEIKNISKSFGNLTVFRNLSVSIKRDEKILITGPNGSGKTTLLRCIAALERVDNGKIIVDGFKINPYDSWNNVEKFMKKQKIGFVFQEIQLWPHFTALENLTKPFIVAKGISKNTANKMAEEILTIFGLDGKKYQYPDFLSGGQKRRLFIARALIMDPEILILDEITANLDIELKREIFSIIRKLMKNKTVIIVTHDMSNIPEFIDKIYRLEKGRLISLH
ncbi:MAG: amino acid ABC transporter ATP-binding protein [Candidatus Micrarchaeota archaeon]|nr:amino acid ABC transporter ATP-binding protein [Candidatus Micrarchaeota archaeon]